MAKTKSTGGISLVKKSRKKRPGVHSKKRTSKLKSSKNYTKKYVGQGGK
jgi:hypothetical protein